jgi:hypothetical protein
VVKDFKLGCHWLMVQPWEKISIEDQFRRVQDSGLFDYMDWLPRPELLDECIRASQKLGFPMLTGSYNYMLGRDEAALERDLRNAARAGLELFNIMIYTKAGDSHDVTDAEVVECYLRCAELGDQIGVMPSFEVHAEMWSENFPRVRRVAEAVRARGVEFRFTQDYSHCILKIENPEEQDISHIRADVEAGRVVLDPFEPDCLADEWLAMNMVYFAQFRPVAPNGPRNLWALDEAGRPRRAIQYPFLKPKPGEWHSPWHAHKLAASKEAIRKVFRYHLTHDDSPLGYLNTEMIALPDYGLNARYSIFEHNCACARWLRATWDQMKAMHAAGVALTP